MARKIMSWDECGIDIGATGANDAMGATLSSIGTVKDKSTTLEASDGDKLSAVSSGGHKVGGATREGGYVLKTRIIEPGNSLYTTLGLGAVSGDDYDVKTHVVSGDWSFKLTPKNVGAIGVKAPVTNVSFKPGYSEEEGSFADVEFDILYSETTEVWYKRFIKAAVTTPSNPE